MNIRILITLVIILFINCKKDTAEKPLLAYIPEHSAAIITIKEHEVFLSTLEGNPFLKKLDHLKSQQKLVTFLEFLKYVQPKSESILAFSSTDKENDTFDFTYITKLTENLFDIDSLKNKSIESLTAENNSYKKYTLDSSVFYSTIIEGKIIVSSSRSLLEEIGKNEPAPPSKTLQKLYATTHSAESASILVNLKRSSSAANYYLKQESPLTIDHFSDWVSLDVDIDSEKLLLTGVSIASDSTSNYINLFSRTLPAVNNTPFFTPSVADAFLSYTYNSHANFAQNQEKYLGHESIKAPSLEAVEELGIMYITNEKAIILNTFGAETIADYLKSKNKGTEEYQGAEILELETSDFLNLRFAPLVNNFKANFCSIIENAFIFSENKALLKTIISSHQNGTTFNKTNSYKTLNEGLAEESSMLFMGKAEKIRSLLQDELSAVVSKELKTTKLSGYAVGVQTIADNNFHHTTLLIKKKEHKTNKQEIKTLVSVQLPKAIANQPQFVTNHLNHKKEIIVQDQENTLYLISNSGKTLWKKPLKGAIQGKIQQIDLFKNGRLQFAFTTNNQLLVLDRNGKEVKQLTKTFDGGNLNPLSVFDYEKRKNYRFVVTQNDKVFMYNGKGKIVKGFKYKKAKQPIIAAPQHFTLGAKDYLAFKLKDGTLKILNRTGDVRTNVKEKIDFSENNIYLYKDKFTLTDKKGTLYRIATNGKITKTNFNLSNDHGIYATAKSLAIMNDNILTIKGKKVTLDLGVYTPPTIFYINNKIFVSVTDLQTQKIHLFDSQGKAITNSPIFGNSAIDLSDIDGDKWPELLTKENDDTIVVYKIY